MFKVPPKTVADPDHVPLILVENVFSDGAVGVLVAAFEHPENRATTHISDAT